MNKNLNRQCTNIAINDLMEMRFRNIDYPIIEKISQDK